jgi:uncharacterized protein YndB with AHSA1/START domain
MLLGETAFADVTSASPQSFLVTVTRDVSASPHQVYDGIGHIGQWWSSEHTWSGKAENLSLDMSAGGCFCEQWSGGSVLHGQVIAAKHDEMLRLQTSLGPLQALAVNGILTFSLKAIEGKTTLALSYRVSGNADSALDTLAAPVDGVLTEQVSRLANLIETGDANIKPATAQ